MKHATCAAAMIAAALLCAGTVQAQAPDTLEALAPGRRSVSVGIISGGSGELGIWRMKDSRLNRGLFLHVTADYVSSESGTMESDDWSVSAMLGPRWRRYASVAAPIAPFGQLQLGIGGHYRRDTAGIGAVQLERESWGALASASLAGGAEWFPAKRASVSAHTGASLDVRYARSNDSPDSRQWRVGVSTFTSALALQLYF